MSESTRILIVDDTSTNCILLEALLDEAGYPDSFSVLDPREAVEAFRRYSPDLVLLDLHMPHLDGLAVMAALRQEPGAELVPVLMLTADVSPDARQKALAAGIKDFLTKPFDETEVTLRIRNLLETRRLHERLNRQNEALEAIVSERTREAERAKIETLERLALAAELRDDTTGHHTQRVGRLSGFLAAALGLDDDAVQLIRRAAPLHDIGKIATPDKILLKAGRLTRHEWLIMKRHTVDGARLLSNSVAGAVQMAQTIALSHHERWDGNGYLGMKGKDIPFAGRLVAITDVFDALTHRRPYKEAWTEADALTEIRAQRGRQFDPEIVDAFLEMGASVELMDPTELPEQPVIDLSEAESVVTHT